MTKKNIAIQCPCGYTRMGIEDLLRKKNVAKKCKIVTSTSHFGQFEEHLKVLRCVDIIIVTLSSAVDDPVSTLSFFGEYLPSVNPKARILLVADIVPNRVMAQYLLFSLNSIDRILDVSKSLRMIESQLVDVIEMARDEPKSCRKAMQTLSLRENFVLRRLLNGEKMSLIAKDLRVSIKTVSHNKRSALIKLGIRTLQPLIINAGYKKRNTKN